MPSPTIPAAYGLYQSLRAIEPPDSPLPGTLARAADGSNVLLVDREAVAEWPGWGAAGEPHILTPLDVVRRADGHDVVVPALTERLSDLWQRRSDAQAPLSPGEAVTLGVSIVRGLTPSLMRAGDIDGEWWLADDGRPLLVEGVGDVPTREASANLLAAVGDAMPRTRIGAALRELADATLHPGFIHGSAEWEERLFACAEPEPLVTEVLGPLRARRVATVPVERVTEPRTLWQRLAFHADADLATAASDAVTATLRRLRRMQPRPRPLLIAASLATVIVVGGLLWPRTADDTVATAALASAPPSDDPGDATPPAGDATDTAPPVEPNDLASVTTQLLDTRNGCSDTACLASVLEDPARPLPAGVIDEPAEQRQTALLDDLGGLVVVRVDSLAGLPVQLVTVVETEEGWRIRDVHDVTDAPS